MGIFDKLKKVFSKEDKEVFKYDNGLKKTRLEFTSKLTNLSNKYKFILPTLIFHTFKNTSLSASLTLIIKSSSFSFFTELIGKLFKSIL